MGRGVGSLRDSGPIVKLSRIDLKRTAFGFAIRSTETFSLLSSFNLLSNQIKYCSMSKINDHGLVGVFGFCLYPSVLILSGRPLPKL